MKYLIEGTDATFEQEVLKADVPVLVDFWAPWCGPCRMIAPIVEEIANQYNGKLKVVNINTDENQDTAVRYGIRSIPTPGLFMDGNVVGTLIGADPRKVLKDKLKVHIET